MRLWKQKLFVVITAGTLKKCSEWKIHSRATSFSGSLKELMKRTRSDVIFIRLMEYQ